MARNNAKGFTIVELMIAIGVMSVVILIITIGVIQLSRYYQQGRIKSAMLDASREMHTKFAQDLQYSGYDPIGPIAHSTDTTFNVVCTGLTRYYFNLTTNEFGSDAIGGSGECSTKVIDHTKSPMPLNVKVTQFNLTMGTNGVFRLDTRFVYGTDTGLFDGGSYNNECIAVAAGGSYCATVQLSSTLVRKVSG